MAIDATVSGVSANSYVSDAEFLAYGAGSLASARIAASTADTRERALITAARMMDRLRFDGLATIKQQARQWPRYTVLDPDRWGYLFQKDEIPRRVKEAQCELALALLKAGQVSPDGQLTDASQYVKARVDVLEVEYRVGVITSTSASGILRRFPAVWSLIAPLVGAGGGMQVARA